MCRVYLVEVVLRVQASSRGGVDESLAAGQRHTNVVLGEEQVLTRQQQRVRAVALGFGRVDGLLTEEDALLWLAGRGGGLPGRCRIDRRGAHSATPPCSARPCPSSATTDRCAYNGGVRLCDITTIFGRGLPLLAARAKAYVVPPRVRKSRKVEVDVDFTEVVLFVRCS